MICNDSGFGQMSSSDSIANRIAKTAAFCDMCRVGSHYACSSCWRQLSLNRWRALAVRWNERLALRCRENSQGKVIPSVRFQCDRPYRADPFNCLLKGTVFALHEIVSHKKAGSVLARGAMNEDWNASADVLFSERKCYRKNAKTMLKIALLWRCVI